VNSALYYLFGLSIFKHVFEYSIATFYSLIFCLNNPEYLAKSDNRERGISWCGIVRGESIESYNNGNKLYYI
jgi:hypothetical protein